MTQPVSAALLVYRRGPGGPEFLLAHPGGPFWRKRDTGAWSIPKGLANPGEDLLAAARREFAEEVGFSPEGPAEALAPQRQKGGKLVCCWMMRADLDLAGFRSNTFDLEWPKGSGRIRAFPEIDRVAYLPPEEALIKILEGQRPILLEALSRLNARP